VGTAPTTQASGLMRPCNLSTSVLSSKLPASLWAFQFRYTEVAVKKLTAAFGSQLLSRRPRRLASPGDTRDTKSSL
jgi:hypothetical protein